MNSFNKVALAQCKAFRNFNKVDPSLLRNSREGFGDEGRGVVEGERDSHAPAVDSDSGGVEADSSQTTTTIDRMHEAVLILISRGSNGEWWECGDSAKSNKGPARTILPVASILLRTNATNEPEKEPLTSALSRHSTRRSSCSYMQGVDLRQEKIACTTAQYSSPMQ